MRGCRAALGLVAGVETLNEELEREWGVRLQVRIGVNTGQVVAGNMTRGGAHVSGDAVNTAARLEQAAGAGEVLIGATTRELLGESAVCTPIAPLTLKGKAETVPAWRLIAIEQATTQFTAVAATTAPLVGRDDELERLEIWCTERKHDRPGGTCLLLGAAGVGKSRLLNEVVARSSARMLWGRCPPYGEGSTYEPLAAWIETLGDEAVEDVAGDDAARALFFGAGRDEQPATASEIKRGALALAAGLAESEKLLVFVEDVHWAETAMLDVLDALASVAGVGVVLSARPEVLEARSALAARPSDLRLRLAPLDDAWAGALAQAIVPDLTAADRERLLRMAEGSPLVIGQLARHLAEGGRTDSLPLGLEAVLQARVENLSPEERAVAERAAIMGREFWDTVIAELEPNASSPAAALASLTRREFIAWGRADGAQAVSAPTLSRVFDQAAQPYSFTHALLRDAVYRAVPKLRRAELHERLADLLEKRTAPDELLAFHLEQAAKLRAELRPDAARSLAARAAKRLERAGERALLRQDGDDRPCTAHARGGTARRLGGARSDREEPRGGRPLKGSRAGARGYLRRLPCAGGCRQRWHGGCLLGRGRRRGPSRRSQAHCSHLGGRPRFRERFARESRIAAHLEHPNVVPVYAAGEEQGQLFIAMRYVEGTDLQALLRGGAIDHARGAAIVAQVAEALDAAHARGLVHRDVKPANVLVTQAGSVEHAYLTDFGLTRESTAVDGLTRAGQWVGTLAYVAPEQIRAEPVDARADVYALGAVLYQCLTGELPYAVETELEALAAHLDMPPPVPSGRGAPRVFDRVIARAMSKDPVQRYRSAGDLGRAALAAARGERPRLTERSVATGAAAPVDTGRRAQRPHRPRTLLIASGAGAIAVGVAIIAAFAAGAFSGSAAPKNPAGHLVGHPFALPAAPDHVAAGNGQVWTLSDDGGDLVRVDRESGAVRRYPPAVDLGGGTYPGLSATDRGVWVVHRGHAIEGTEAVSGIDHVDPRTGEALQHVPLAAPSAIAVGDGSVWAVSSDDQGRGQLVRIDSARDVIADAPVKLGRDPAGIAVGPAAIWVANRGDDSVWRIDPHSRAVAAKVAVGDGPSVVRTGPGGVWVLNSGDSTITRIDPSSNQPVGAPISLGKQLTDLVVTQDAVWVSAADGTVTRLDPRTGRTIGTSLSPGTPPLALAPDGASVWVASPAEKSISQIEEGRA